MLSLADSSTILKSWQNKGAETRQKNILKYFSIKKRYKLTNSHWTNFYLKEGKSIRGLRTIETETCFSHIMATLMGFSLLRHQGSGSSVLGMDYIWYSSVFRKKRADKGSLFHISIFTFFVVVLYCVAKRKAFGWDNIDRRASSHIHGGEDDSAKIFLLTLLRWCFKDS